MKWLAPRIWEGQRCFVLAGGSSLPIDRVKRIRGNILAVKHTAELRPDAEVMLFAGKDGHNECRKAIAGFRGKYLVRRGSYPVTPPNVWSIGRLGADPVTGKARLSDDPARVGGFCTGSSAINLAYLLGATEIVLLGFDMRGGHWAKGVPKPFPGKAEFERHINGINDMAIELRARNIRVVNCSPISALRCFETGNIDDFL